MSIFLTGKLRQFQAEVHSHTTAPLVDFVVRGYNATVFAYGPTGSGKTYTMVGTRENPGLMTLLTRSLYDKINPNEYTVYISFLVCSSTSLIECLPLQEIYNEVIKDLLNPSAGTLDLLEDEKGNVQVPGLSRVKAPNTTRVCLFFMQPYTVSCLDYEHSARGQLKADAGAYGCKPKLIAISRVAAGQLVQERRSTREALPYRPSR